MECFPFCTRWEKEITEILIILFFRLVLPSLSYFYSFIFFLDRIIIHHLRVSLHVRRTNTAKSNIIIVIENNVTLPSSIINWQISSLCLASSFMSLLSESDLRAVYSVDMFTFSLSSSLDTYTRCNEE